MTLLKMKHMWIKKKGKVHWLINLDDDLRYLYSSLKEMNNSNSIRELHTHREIISKPIKIIG